MRRLDITPDDDLSQLDKPEVHEHLLAEARRIIAGKTKMLPTRAHLAAALLELDAMIGLAPELPDKPFSLYRDADAITTDEIGAIVSALEDDLTRFAITFLELRLDVRTQREHLETLEQRVSGLLGRESIR